MPTIPCKADGSDLRPEKITGDKKAIQLLFNKDEEKTITPSLKI